MVHTHLNRIPICVCFPPLPLQPSTAKKIRSTFDCVITPGHIEYNAFACHESRHRDTLLLLLVSALGFGVVLHTFLFIFLFRVFPCECVSRKFMWDANENTSGSMHEARGNAAICRICRSSVGTKFMEYFTVHSSSNWRELCFVTTFRLEMEIQRTQTTWDAFTQCHTIYEQTVVGTDVLSPFSSVFRFERSINSGEQSRGMRFWWRSPFIIHIVFIKLMVRAHYWNHRIKFMWILNTLYLREFI